MPRETKETEIDGHRYQVTQLGADTSDLILFRSAPAVAAGIRAFLRGAGSADSIAGALIGTLGAMSLEDFKFVKDAMREATRRLVVDELAGGKSRWVPLKVDYDDHFAGRNLAALKWLRFALEVNFGPFFAGLSELADGLRGLSPSSSQATPAGGPGDSSPAPG